MKKHLTTVAIFLLAGAVVNVAVAWGCAIRVDRFQVSWSELGQGDGWVVSESSRLGVKVFGVTRMKRLGMPVPEGQSTLYTLVPKWGGLDRATAVFREAEGRQCELVVESRSVIGCGWPALVLWSDISRVRLIHRARGVD